MKCERAIVIGGSVAGLLIARTLSDFFDETVIIERGLLPQEVVVRKEVPQAAHVHGLVGRGVQVIEELFPGISAALENDGAVTGDVGEGVRIFQFGTWKPEVKMNLRGHLQSRPALEWHLRRRVAAISNVRVLPGIATGLIASAGGARVAGVRVGTEGMAADLVVDASGRGTRSAAWLEASGFSRPAVTEVRINLGYATRMFRRRDDETVGLLILPEPPRGKRIGAAFPIEGNRWIVTLAGVLNDHPPLDEAGYLAFAKSLPAPEIYERFREREPVGDACAYKFPASIRRHFASLRPYPERFLVVGDALASFNPIYGQGMATAALEAITIRDELARRADRAEHFAVKVQARLEMIVDMPWSVAVGGDFGWPGTVGERAFGTGLVNWYVARLHRLAGTDPELVRAFYRVLHMLEGPRSLFRPTIAARVLTRRVRTRPGCAKSGKDESTHGGFCDPTDHFLT